MEYWNTVKGSDPRPHITKAVYSTKKSDRLRAPPRGYNGVGLNVTTSDKEDVRKWMTDNSVDVMGHSLRMIQMFICLWLKFITRTRT